LPCAASWPTWARRRAVLCAWCLLAGRRRALRLVRDQVHFLGNYSLAIIAVSGLFVGFVLGLQGYYTLQRYGSSEALGCWWR
jgi:phospholipid/cholesterol/gamma-HCH transport system permease protein